ncbi:hypothetical protein [Neisseria weaveri]|uniref:Uncharacterized protein n=1 Tax=Neisseria weaveri TaxID=28091 RepID=A0A3S5B2Z9_9NEIS|nr:hypothetical protein [Neisseria weaveri]EGV38460.1 hypothetical protein l11_04830 [Neisseria weaveri LMG 5135]VEJ49980.1 Uncharacterised protein [Neisseria weaveri]
MLQYSEVVKTIVLNPIALLDDELNFKLEILKNGNGKFYARLFRLETYKVKPSFTQDILADEAQYVLDLHTVPELGDTSTLSAEDCLNSALQALQKKFS